MAVKQDGIISKASAEMAEKRRPQNLKEWTEMMMPQVARALPKVITPERFTRIALTALSNNKQLMECTRDSFLGGLMQAAQLGLEPNTPLGQAYLIPYRNNKKGVTECQFQIGYKGLIDLAYRSGDVSTIQAYCVYENDVFEYELGLEPKLKHIPAKRDRGALEYVYAVFKLVNGGYGFEVMSIEDVNNHANKYSQAFKTGYGPWKDNYEEMAKKTVLKRVLKYAPIKTEFLQGVAADGGVSTVDANRPDPNEIEVSYSVVEAEDERVVADTTTGEVIGTTV